jgi:pimeloyl-ACP methyl ester carboxylesterase
VYRTEIVDAAFTILSSCGHLPHVEQPEALANTVLKYLERSGSQA